MTNKRIKHIKSVKKWQNNNRGRYLSYQKWYNDNIRSPKKIGNIDTEVLYGLKNKDKFERLLHKQAEYIRKYAKNYKQNDNIE